jgi:hypothetical protein
VLQLEPVELQELEEEGGHWQHQPSHSVAGEVDKFRQLKVDEQKGAASHQPIESWQLPAKQTPQPPEVIL